MKLRGVFHHAVAPVGGDDADAHALGVAHMVGVGEVHRARMKRGDLIVVEIGGDERLRGIAVVDEFDVRAVDAAAIHPVAVRPEVVAHRAHRQRLAAQQVEVVGDVARAAAEFAAQIGHQK